MESQKIKLLIVDDHEVVITGVKAVLSKFPEFEIIDTANDGKEAFEKIITQLPDIIIMDVMLPDTTGIELTVKLKQILPDVKVILHTSYIDEENIINGFNSGVLGYVPKNFSVVELIDAIKTVNSGGKYLTGIVSQILVENVVKSNNNPTTKTSEHTISEREKEIIKYIALGHLNKEIADKLAISIRTVEAHKSNILKKLNLNSKADLIIYAIKHKIIKI